MSHHFEVETQLLAIMRWFDIDRPLAEKVREYWVREGVHVADAYRMVR